MMGHLELSNILSTNQFSFRQKRSADLQLLTVHDLASSLNDKAQTNYILLDFSKTFDQLGFAQTLTVEVKVLWNYQRDNLLDSVFFYKP